MDKVQRADLALADLTANGGVLDAEHQNTFFRKIIDEPTVIKQIRQQQMSAPEMRIPKIGFGSRVLRPAPNTGSGGAQDSGANTRHLAANLRAKPDFEQVNLKTTEFIAEIHLHDDLLEDNIEKDAMADTIMTLLAERVALDLEELLIKADKATAAGADPDGFLRTMDGLLKMSDANVVDADAAPVSINVYNDMKKAMPTRFRRNLSTLRYLNSMDVESDYRVQVAARGTALGDAILTGSAPLPVLGTPLQGVALMPEAQGLLIDPKNVIFGIQRNVRIERARDIRARSWIIVLTMRIGFAIEEKEAIVKLIDLGQ
jgi:HK97 family phage major capsid protein